MSAQFLFFSGKGGVGKTSMACATAIHNADAGMSTLIVTTDPASNLADVFEQPIGHQVTQISGVPGLWAMEIDPDRATEDYINRAMAPIRAAFPAQMVTVMEEQMSGPCTAEVAAFDRFVDFLEPASGNANGDSGERPLRFDVVIFDTAPTGHTLRLLELPAEWSRSIADAEQGSGQTCIGPAAAIQDAKQKYERALATLRDDKQTRFVFVLQAEATAIKETQRAIAELAKLEIHTHELIVNAVIPAAAAENPLFAQRRAMQQGYLERIGRDLRLPTRRMELLIGEVRGIERLRFVGRSLFNDAQAVSDVFLPRVAVGGAPPGHRHSAISAVRGKILPDGERRVLFFAGKGGVGKTVASCITAVWLARQGVRTLLLTTDPAAHLSDVLEVPVGDTACPVPGVPGLWAANIDAKAAAIDYRERILADARSRGRTEAAIRVMEEELDSPCTEEMAAFDRFIDYASQSKWDAIVFDTAPTGHTLRLLQLPVDWSKQLDIKVFASVESSAADDVTKQRFGAVIDMMRDPAQSTFAFVMYPESTPVIEAYRASVELRTLGIEPGLVVANQVIPVEAATTPFAQARRAMQEQYLAEIGERFQTPVVEIPLLSREIRGIELLIEVGKQVYESAPELAPVV